MISSKTPAGYTLAVKGVNYGVYYKSDGSRGDKNTEREDLTQDIQQVNGQQQALKGEKFIKDGQLFIRCGEQVYDIMGKPVK